MKNLFIYLAFLLTVTAQGQLNYHVLSTPGSLDGVLAKFSSDGKRISNSLISESGSTVTMLGTLYLSSLNDNTGVAKMLTTTNGIVSMQSIPTGGGGSGENFFNSNLTLTGNRTHIGDDNGFKFSDIGYFIFETSKRPAVTDHYSFIDAANNVISIGNYSLTGTINSKIDLSNNGAYLTGPIYINLPTFESNAAASSLLTGRLYKTSTGELRIKL